MAKKNLNGLKCSFVLKHNAMLHFLALTVQYLFSVLLANIISQIHKPKSPEFSCRAATCGYFHENIFSPVFKGATSLITYSEKNGQFFKFVIYDPS